MKRSVAFILVLVLVLTLCATALAAKPTAYLITKYKSQHVRRGKTISFQYKVDSRSYGLWYGCHKVYKRAMLCVQNAYNGYVRSHKDGFWAGKQTTPADYFKWSTYGAAKGKWISYYTTYYRTTGLSCWYKVKQKKTAFYIY